MFYVYIIRSAKSGKLYKGCTGDLKRRMRDYNSKKVTSTKNGSPWTLIYYQGLLSKTDALREEKFLKSGKGRDRINILLENTFKTIEEK